MKQFNHPTTAWVVSSEKHIWGFSIETEVQGRDCIPSQLYPEDRPAFNQLACKDRDPGCAPLWALHHLLIVLLGIKEDSFSFSSSSPPPPLWKRRESAHLHWSSSLMRSPSPAMSSQKADCCHLFWRYKVHWGPSFSCYNQYWAQTTAEFALGRVLLEKFNRS